MAIARKTNTVKVQTARKADAAVAKPVPVAPAAVSGAAAKKVATKATAAPAKLPPVKKAAAAKPAASRAATREVPISAGQRAHYVEVAAFYIAERRGFAAGNPNDDWLAAEAEVDRLIATGHFAR